METKNDFPMIVKVWLETDSREASSASDSREGERSGQRRIRNHIYLSVIICSSRDIPSSLQLPCSSPDFSAVTTGLLGLSFLDSGDPMVEYWHKCKQEGLTSGSLWTRRGSLDSDII